MDEGARQAFDWAWRNRVESQLWRNRVENQLGQIIVLLERLILVNLGELSPDPVLSPDGENEEESET